jgi:hypothetical protein
MHRTRRALLGCLLVALSVSLGMALSGVPNVELVTLTVFAAGFLLGPGAGACVGAASAALFSAFNPLGTALPPLVAAQAVGQLAVGWSGGVFGPLVARVENRFFSRAVAAGVGFVLTVSYDVVTNAGAYVTIAGEKSLEGLVKFTIAGILFVGVHIVWNTLVFGATLVPILRVLSRYREELNTG